MYASLARPALFDSHALYMFLKAAEEELYGNACMSLCGYNKIALHFLYTIKLAKNFNNCSKLSNVAYVHDHSCSGNPYI